MGRVESSARQKVSETDWRSAAVATRRRLMSDLHKNCPDTHKTGRHRQPSVNKGSQQYLRCRPAEGFAAARRHRLKQ